MTTASTTLRALMGLNLQPTKMRDAALVLIDCQNTYRTGITQLIGVEEALRECQALLNLARELQVPVFHVRHDAGPGTPYDVQADIGAISPEVAPANGEPVITKHYPNSFIQTDLDAQLKAAGVQNLILAGFMTHMCINSTAHGAFNLGYNVTVVANATATRPLETANGEIVSAEALHRAAIAATRDLYAAIADSIDDIR